MTTATSTASEVIDSAAMPRRGGRFAEIALPAAGVIIGMALILGPFLATVIRSVLYWDADGAALSVKNFAGLFADPRFYQAAGNTILCGIGATVISCVLGLSLAWVVSRTDMPGRRWFEVFNLVPFFLSPYVGAISWIYLAAPHSGILSRFLHDTFGLPGDLIPIYSIGGATWVLSLFYTPYVYLFVIAPMRQMDPALEDAARVHGAGFWTTLRLVTLPLLLPALMSAALIVFVTSAGLFDVPLALASPHGIRTMPTEIFQLVQYPSDLGRAASFGVVVMVFTILVTVLQRRYIDRRRFETVTGKGYRPRTIALRPGGRAAALALEAVYIGCGVVLPVIALLMVSFSSIWTGKVTAATLTLRNYEYVAFNYHLTQQAIMNSLFLALVGATLGVGMSVLQAYYVNRGARKRRGLVDAILSLPLGIPGIILGLGFLILAIRTPLYSTLGDHPHRLCRAVLPVRHPHGVGDAARDQPGARAERAGERRHLAADHALRAPAAADAGDRRRVADAVRDLHPRTRRHHPALCPGHRDHQRGAGGALRTQHRLRRGAGGDPAHAAADRISRCSARAAPRSSSLQEF